MLTRKYLEEAPMWTIFTGDAEDPGPILWDIFHITPADSYPEEVERKMDELGVTMDMPQKEDDPEESPQPRDDVDDVDAALAFLRSGGALCKVPDAEDPTSPRAKYWRLFVIEPVALADVFLRLISFDAIPTAPPAIRIVRKPHPSVASLLRR